MMLTVIIPVFNEEKTIAEIVSRVQGSGVPDLEIIVVDDCSSDGTLAELHTLETKYPNLTVLQHLRNRGKGCAIQTARERILGDVVVIQDGDLEYSPTEFPRLLRPIEDGVADAVFGSRYSGNEILVDTYVHYMGNRLLTTFSNVLSNVHLTDMETCYKMVRADIFRKLRLTSKRFGFEPELTAKLARIKARIFEIPISYNARPFSDGKKIGWRDGVAALGQIAWYNLIDRQPLRSVQHNRQGVTARTSSCDGLECGR